MVGVLECILAAKRAEVSALAGRLADLRAACRQSPRARPFAAALRRRAVPGGHAASGRQVAVIAEIKHRSPSAGVIISPFRPDDIARQYAAAGADAISCLTDEQFFGGSIGHLTSVRAAVDLPLLRKDFIIDAVQVYEARAAGADAILLIAEALEQSVMTDLVALAAELGMDVLAEAHSAEMLQKAIDCGAACVGINNRDLVTFKVDLATTVRLAPLVRRAGRVLVAESGIKTPDDVRLVRDAGADAILVGEGLLRSGRVAEALNALKQA